jgi:hypothetical protein
MGVRQRLHFLSAVGGPLNFSFKSGHFWSALKSRAMDRKGRAVPWYTYPMIEYLAQLDFSDADVLEFGGGQSTMWWCERAQSVTTLESNSDWRAELASRTTGRATVLQVSSPSDAARTLGDRKFDVIVVDDGSAGGPEGRVDNARTAFSHLKPGGLIVVDNSDADYTHPISMEASEAGWTRVDFIGFAPGSWGLACSSLLFKETPVRLRPAAPPQIALGG